MYKTELMEEILKSPKAQEIVQQISPIYGEAYTTLWLFQVIGTVLDMMEEWTSTLAAQTVPHTATWSLPYWEEQYNLTSDPSWSDERRRQNIINRCVTRAPVNPYKLTNIVAVAAGAEARIEERTGKNHFTVYVSGRHNSEDEQRIKEAIDRIKPAHLIYTIIFEQYIENTNYIGGIIQAAKEVTLLHRDDFSYISLQEKVITENGIYRADDGYDGLSQVTVDVEDDEDLSDLPIAEGAKF